MTENPDPRTRDELIEDLREFITAYYPDRVSELAQSYNSDKTNAITIEWSDIFMGMKADTDGNHPAEDYLNAPDHMDELLTAAVSRIDVPNVELENVEVRVVGLNDDDIYKPIEIDRDQPHGRSQGPAYLDPRLDCVHSRG